MRFLLLCALLAFAAAAGAEQLTPVWVELGDGGVAIARVVVASSGECPGILIDGESRRMQERLPVPQGFLPACELSIAAGTKSAVANGRTLALPKPDPTRIVVFGDTGCRISRTEIQDCNDAAHWPFPRVAARAAAAKPDLMIDVGDYLYREVMCPPDKSSFCGGTPNGDNWATWNADFFQPASELLAAVPLVFARGNHESCARSWRGWFYYLDPHAWRGNACESFEPPYPITLGSFQLVVFDSSAVVDNMPAQQIERYSRELASIRAKHAWLVVHHPFWGFSTAASPPRPVSPGLEAAWTKARPRGIDLVVSGHVHLFELLSFHGGLPPALVAGQGGTNLANPIRTELAGRRIGHFTVLAGTSEHQFGYTLLTRMNAGWNLTLQSLDDLALADCSIHGRHTSCRNLGNGTQ